MPEPVVIDLSDVWAAFGSMRHRARHLRDVFLAFRPTLQAETRQHFAQELGEAGHWPPRAASSYERIAGRRGSRVKRKGAFLPGALTKRGVRRLQNQLGRLKSAIIYTVTTTYIEARSIVPWAGVHQFGGTAARGVSIPQREFLWASEAAVAKLVNKVRLALLGAFVRKGIFG